MPNRTIWWFAAKSCTQKLPSEGRASECESVCLCVVVSKWSIEHVRLPCRVVEAARCRGRAVEEDGGEFDASGAVDGGWALAKPEFTFTLTCQ